MVVDGDDGFDGSGRRMEGRSWWERWEMTACRAPSRTVEFHSRWMRAISVHSDHQKVTDNPNALRPCEQRAHARPNLYQCCYAFYAMKDVRFVRDHGGFIMSSALAAHLFAHVVALFRMT
jgi:hypothetical protein